MTTPNAFKELRLLSVGEVAKQVGVHRSTVWHWFETGQLGFQKVGERYRGCSRDQLKKSDIVQSYMRGRAAAAKSAAVASKMTKKRQSTPAASVSRKRK